MSRDKLLHAAVRHKAFGDGIVSSYQIDGVKSTLSIAFSSGETKGFLFYKQFLDFFTFADPEARAQAETYLSQIEAQKTAVQKNKKRREFLMNKDTLFNDTRSVPNIFLKFDGNYQSVGREIVPHCVEKDGRALYPLNFKRFPANIRGGMPVFMCYGCVFSDESVAQVICARGTFAGDVRKEHVEDAWLKKYSWMRERCWYAALSKLEILDTTPENGIRLFDMLDRMRNLFYHSTEHRPVSVPLSELKKIHCRRPYIYLTDVAGEALNEAFEEKKKTYGSVIYIDE